MKLLDEVVEEAKEWKKANPDVESRANAWRWVVSFWMSHNYG
jgi:hypothetical protein